MHLPRIDHIIIGATDLAKAADHFYETYGLKAYTGGKHQGWGKFAMTLTKDNTFDEHYDPGTSWRIS